MLPVNYGSITASLRKVWQRGSDDHGSRCNHARTVVGHDRCTEKVKLLSNNRCGAPGWYWVYMYVYTCCKYMLAQLLVDLIVQSLHKQPTIASTAAAIYTYILEELLCSALYGFIG